MKLTISWTDIVVLSLSLIPLIFGIGDYGFYEPHEGHFAGVAREMILRQDWITPTLNGSHYLNKPPLLYWLIASSYTLFGFSEWAARFTVAIAGYLGVIIAWKWGRELWNPLAGQMAALMLSLSLGWFIFSHQILIDLLLSTLILLSYYLLWKLVWTQASRSYWLAFYLVLGFCVLAKGPLMLIYPGIAILGLIIKRREQLKTLKPILGSLIIIAMVAPWAIALESYNPGAISYFLINENFKRIADTRWPPDYTVSQASIESYLLITAIWCLPWSLFIPQILRFTWLQWQNSQDHRQKQEGILLLTIGFLAPILLFLPISSRLIYYSLPAIAPFALLTAGWWSQYPHLIRRFLIISAAAILVYLNITNLFIEFQDQRSSQKIIAIAQQHIPPDTIWIFEGSRELGTAGAMSYYLGPDQSKIPDQAIGWTKTQPDTGYKIILILNDGGPNRILPNFPGQSPEYAISKTQLQKYWDSDQPVIFITDFLRDPQDQKDPITRNLPRNPGQPLLQIENRTLYGNKVVRQQWVASLYRLTPEEMKIIRDRG